MRLLHRGTEGQNQTVYERAALEGSPRPKGSTRQMIDAFREGAISAGHTVEIADVCKMKIEGCLACEYCHTKGKRECVQKDEMQKIYALLGDAQMLVIASPIYYHGISGQLKCAIDRFYSAAYPVGPSNLKMAAMIFKGKKEKRQKIPNFGNFLMPFVRMRLILS